MAASSSSSSSSTSSSLSPSPPVHESIAYFDNQPTSIASRVANETRQSGSHPVSEDWKRQGERQLLAATGDSSSSGWLPSHSDEQATILSFLDWANGSAAALVRCVASVLPPETWRELEGVVSEAKMLDFAPKSRLDDLIFEKNRDVWEKITRGCTLLQITTKRQPSTPLYYWAVRANRKFTGHEDDGRADARLYCVEGVAEPTRVVVTHKCNGSVLHFASRDISIDGVNSRWVFVGSKRVHVGCVWTNVDEWKSRMSLFNNDRYEYVSDMIQFVHPTLQTNAEQVLSFLAKYRLTLNGEYISSVGSGPIDNQQIYNLQPDSNELFVFSFTFNSIETPKNVELGLEPMFGLYIATQLGFKTVSAFDIGIEQLPDTKSQICMLSGIEGSVLYYCNEEGGIVELEKWKSSSYVVIRAVREKLKHFVYGNKAKPGLKMLLENLSTFQQQKQSIIKKVIAVQPTSEKVEWETKLSKAQLRQKNKDKKKLLKAKKNKSNLIESKEEDAAESANASEADGDGESAPDPSPESSSASSSSSSPPSSAIYNLQLTAFNLDQIGHSLKPLGATYESKDKWVIRCPADLEEEKRLRVQVEQVIESELYLKPIQVAANYTVQRITQRLKEINHIPISEEERSSWLSDSAVFIQWFLVQMVTKHRWKSEEVMNQYSQLWSLFRKEAGALSEEERQQFGTVTSSFDADNANPSPSDDAADSDH